MSCTFSVGQADWDKCPLSLTYVQFDYGRFCVCDKLAMKIMLFDEERGKYIFSFVFLVVVIVLE